MRGAPPIDLRETGPDHLQVDVFPVDADNPEDPAVPIHTVPLYVHRLVQDQPSQALGCLLAEWLPRLSLLPGWLWCIDADQTDLDFDVVAFGFHGVPVVNMGDFELASMG